ncbi:polymer-forming cytoskeletal protein [Parabacteroides sp. PF5-9]|uniref:bactofilin family protein n=1 Tax=Parabacteroides sp. PF5-9 TaxID=1742404 RepID=UPI002475C16E|nr:polymer-forming cytoskeletal protein [Parabacteroides sp. PF5-9]MDH6357611.1 cytoskeletal protein CcmA (bactofilin family) [Parabacteroides sp. PF5-9]
MIGIKQKEDVPVSGLHNTMAAGTTIKGDIITEIDFRLDGKVEGDITCRGKLVIGPKGKITGKVISTNAEIMGEIEGSVQIKGKLVLKSTAIIKGDIVTQMLEIEPNARFNGVCTMSSEFRENSNEK